MTRSEAMSLSWLRCPRSTCEDYGKRLVLEVGQHETRGELTVEHRCPSCQYAEFGPSTPDAAKRTSPILAEVRRKLRLGADLGVPVRLVYDTSPFPEADLHA